jgi:hypothetical protein
MNKALEVLFKAAIHHFRLPISLWVICLAKLEFGAWHSKEFLPEITDENRVMVIDYW